MCISSCFPTGKSSQIGSHCKLVPTFLRCTRPVQLAALHCCTTTKRSVVDALKTKTALSSSSSSPWAGPCTFSLAAPSGEPYQDSGRTPRHKCWTRHASQGRVIGQPDKDNKAFFFFKMSLPAHPSFSTTFVLNLSWIFFVLITLDASRFC